MLLVRSPIGKGGGSGNHRTHNGKSAEKGPGDFARPLLAPQLGLLLGP